MLRILLLICFACIVAACSTQPAKVPPPESVSAISKWETSGRVGIRTKKDALSGNFDWQYHGSSDFSLGIVGPFGQGAVKLVGTPNGMVTLHYEDKIVTGPDAEALLENELGWYFPVKQVLYWMRGLPFPDTPSTITSQPDSDLPSQIDQDGWIITYKNFTSVSGLSLPQKMQIANPPYRVNLIITQWSIQ